MNNYFCQSFVSDESLTIKKTERKSLRERERKRERKEIASLEAINIGRER